MTSNDEYCDSNGVVHKSNNEQFNGLKISDVFQKIDTYELNKTYIIVYLSGSAIGYTHTISGAECILKNIGADFLVLTFLPEYSKYNNSEDDALNTLAYRISIFLHDKYKEAYKITWDTIKDEEMPELKFMPTMN